MFSGLPGYPSLVVVSPDTLRAPERTSYYAAVMGAALMIAQQVGAKATRDALFLSNFPATDLPKLMIASASASAVAAFAAAPLLRRLGPARLVPLLYLVSAAMFGVTSVVIQQNVHGAAIFLYLQLGVLGALSISGFWACVNERFDPHTAKALLGRIGAGAALGGVVGGVVAERGTRWLETGGMLLVLAGLNVACAFSVRRVARGSDSSKPAKLATDAAKGDGGYLRQVGLMVFAAAAVAALLDYALKAEAAKRWSSTEELASFFGIFYAVLSISTFVVQGLSSGRSLARLGLGGTLAVLPLLVVMAGTFATAVGRLGSVAMVSGLETLTRNSLFRSAYELLYTPVAANRKRAFKLIIDVAADRAGDVVGALLVLLILASFEVESTRAVTGTAIGVALIMLLLCFGLQRGYVAELATRLQEGSVSLQQDDVLDATTARTLADTTMTIDRERLLREIQVLRERQALVEAEARAEDDPDEPEAEPSSVVHPLGPPDERFLEQAAALLSRDSSQVRQALGEPGFDTRLVPLVLPLLTSRSLAKPALRLLRTIAARCSGQLADALADDAQPPKVRRRVTRALEVCRNQRAFDGLWDGLSDSDLELRFRCGQALSAMVEDTQGELAPRKSRAFRAVLAELHREEAAFSAGSGRVSDVDGVSGRPPAFGRLEHVLNILGLVLDSEPLELCRKALSSRDEKLRGTALEYLDNVLPDEVFNALEEALELHFGRPDAAAPPEATRRK